MTFKSSTSNIKQTKEQLIKASDHVEDNVIIFDSGGFAIDSGINISDILTSFGGTMSGNIDMNDNEINNVSLIDSLSLSINVINDLIISSDTFHLSLGGNSNLASINTALLTNNRDFELPNRSGTFALEGDYLPLNLSIPLTEIDLNGNSLRIIDGGNTKVDFGDGLLYDNLNVESVDYVNRSLKNSSNTISILWASASNGVRIQNSDLKIETLGKGLYVKEGSNATMGIATLVSGTVVVNTTKITNNSRIFLQAQDGASGPHSLHITSRIAGTSFTITSSSAGDTSSIAWLIIEPA